MKKEGHNKKHHIKPIDIALEPFFIAKVRNASTKRPSLIITIPRHISKRFGVKAGQYYRFRICNDHKG